MAKLTNRILFVFVLLLNMHYCIAQNWGPIQITSVAISDTITLGCDVPLNITLHNTTELDYSTTSYSIHFNASTDEIIPDLESEYVVRLRDLYINAYDSITVQTQIAVNPNIFDFDEDETTQKNVVIVWGGDIAVNEDDIESLPQTITNVSTKMMHDASLDSGTTTSFPETLVFEELPIFIQAHISQLIDLDSIADISLNSEAYNEVLYVIHTVDDFYLFLNLNGDVVSVSEDNDPLGQIDIEYTIDTYFYFLSFSSPYCFNEVSLIEVGDHYLYEFDCEGEIFYSNLNGEIISFDILPAEEELDLFLFFEEIGFILYNDLIENAEDIIINPGSSTPVIIIDEYGDEYYFDHLYNLIYTSSDNLEIIGALDEEEIPIELIDYIVTNQIEVGEYQYINELKCNIIYEALDEKGDILISYNPENEDNPFEIGTSIQSILPNDLTIGPNPVYQSLFIDGNYERLSIIAMDGSVVGNYDGVSYVPMHILPVGNYFIKILVAGTYYMQRITKQ